MKSPLKKKITVAALIVSVITSQTALFLFPNKANAVVPVLDVPNLTQNTTTAVSTGSLVAKEYTLDTIAKLAARAIIDAFTRSTVNWINSGFQGSPMFITDLGGFLSDVADEEIGRFIEGSALSFLCDPFQTDIRIALSLQTPFERRISCTLSDVIDNIEGFIGGDFSQGGWAGWFELTTVPQNNPYGAYLASASELEMRIAARQGIESTKLNWGSGFMSWEECEELPADFVGPPRCEIVTPGTLIENQLVNVFGSGLRQLELADELNEILSALVNQLIYQALGGIGGLRGASRSVGGRPPITEQTGGTQDRESLSNIKEFAIVGVEEDIRKETDYRNVKQSTLNSVIASENLLFSLQACYAGKIAGNLSSGDKAIAQQRMNNASVAVASQITPIKTLLENDIKLADENIAELNKFKSDILSARTPQEVDVLVKELVLLRLNGKLAGSDIFSAQQEQSTITAQMSSLNATTNAQISECQTFPPQSSSQQSGNN